MDLNDPENLALFLQSDPTAIAAAQLSLGDEVCLADVLCVIYEGRLKRETVFVVIEKKPIREWLKRFRLTDSFADIVRALKTLMPFEKNHPYHGNGQIEAVFEYSARQYRTRKLGPQPSKEKRAAFMKELEEACPESDQTPLGIAGATSRWRKSTFELFEMVDHGIPGMRRTIKNDDLD
ncbi:MAG: hypothetical protein Q7R35_03375 [Elusimicrobiota bacterium]|nr:hypothetical protein [Elusimicrobiota bacterium]